MAAVRSTLTGSPEPAQPKTSTAKDSVTWRANGMTRTSGAMGRRDALHANMKRDRCPDKGERVMRNALHALVLAVGLAAGCSRSSNDWVTPTPAAEPGGTPVHIVGVVRHREVEGGFFAIEGEDGTMYDPTNLPAAFQKDGL